ncbi:hypothetical protein PROFUN_07481 [Planoprotostelium fungivorum]|uniref:DEX1 C-terminal domain-containing protein n=1 Tax=Planoprotostelium fungivorum TaxID=1890364 RepID=A0A2P6NLJ8_9EUKA|nr:hypothetical protein PROFUN_07481 [Planoprotostelium fungivorum]
MGGFSYRFFFILLSLSVILSQGAIGANKYKDKKPVRPADISFHQASPNNASCEPVPLNMLWMAELGSSVYSTPIIQDLEADGSKEIIIATSQSYVEVIDGRGNKLPGWPYAFPGSVFLAGPLSFDTEGDNRNEIIVSTETGEIVFLTEKGLPESGKTLKVAPLKVEKDWSRGLLSKNVEVSMSLNDQKFIQFQKEVMSYGGEAMSGPYAPKEEDSQKPIEKSTANSKEKSTANSKEKSTGKAERKKVKPSSGRKLQAVENSGKHPYLGSRAELTPEALESFDIFLSTSTPEGYVHQVVQNNDPLYSPQFEQWKSLNLQSKDNGSHHVFVDAHILNTPVVVDLDGDDEFEIIVPVSYFFDGRTYADPAVLSTLDKDVNIADYVASGIAVFSLTTGRLRWILNLDITSENSQYPAYLHSSPTVADFDADGKLEILMGTGLGTLYVIDAHGRIVRQFSMDSIHASVIVEDIDGDGQLEIIACDVNSNVIAFRADGTELWESRISGYPSEAPTVGDIDGDGVLDVVVATVEGHIWALRGDNGKPLPRFPMKFPGRLISQVLLIDLSEKPHTYSSGLHLVTLAQDGNLYIIHGRTSCVYTLDLGESSRCMVLAEDITGNGKMDLVVTTRSGRVYLLSTTAPYHPLKPWVSYNQGRNGYTARENLQGIFVRGQNRDTRDISRESFSVQFEIVDKRPKHLRPPVYRVKILYGNHLLFKREYKSAGFYTEVMTSPLERMSTMIYIEMTNEYGQAFFDSFSVTFHKHFYRIIKYALVVPMLVIGAFVTIYTQRSTTPLPLST